MGIKERRQREREARRHSVLAATRALLAERGFNGTTTRRIAERCELSEATLFFHFKSKDGILVSLLFEGIDHLAAGIAEIAASEAPRRERLRALWRFFTEVRGSHPEYFQVFAYLAHPQSTATVDDDVKAEIARRSGDNFRRFAALLGDLLEVPDARLAADTIWGLLVGLMVLRDSRANLDASPHQDDDELAAAFELLLDGLLGGAGPRGAPPP